MRMDKGSIKIYQVFRVYIYPVVEL